MLLAKSMLPKLKRSFRSVLALGLISLPFTGFAQYNSPYSRYGIGDAVPSTNISLRGMGGITTAYVDRVSVNFNNPASYARFYATKQRNSNKLENGRVILDAGVSLENRTLVAPNTPQSFATSDLIFNYVQVGIPLRTNWGLSFGIRPVSRIGYKINRAERLFDPTSLNTIDSAITQFNGAGGSYLPSVGTGISFGNFSIGANMGYLFGNRENNTRRVLLNDTVSYYASEHRNNFSFGGLFFNSGIQYQFSLKNNTSIRLGVAGNWKQNLSGSYDKLTQTFITGSGGETLQLDSVYAQTDVSGEMIYPVNYSTGIVIERNNDNGSGWLFGLDYAAGKWNDYRFFGSRDSVQDNWKFSAGGQFYPKPSLRYFSRVTYRFGFNYGIDYIRVGREMPLMGASFGMALPIRLTRMAPNQINHVNVAIEYQKRGDNETRLKENLFRLSVGFNFTDLWFMKRRYD
jgi:hypothetical protein